VAYVTLADLQAYLPTAIDPSDNARVATLLADASAMIDDYTGQTWEPVFELRHVPLDGERIVNLPGSLLDLDTVVLYDGLTTRGLTEGTDFYALPSGSLDAATPPPAESRYPAHSLMASYGNWSAEPAHLLVTGTWGADSEVPADIRMATVMVASAWCRSLGVGSQAGSEIKAESWDGYSVTYQTPATVGTIPEDALKLLQRYTLGGGLYAV